MSSTPPPPPPANTPNGPDGATTTTIASTPQKSAASTSALDEYYRQWEQKVAGMKQASAAVDWSGADWSKLRPSDIGVQVGPVMTEEQFKEYRRRTGSTPHVLRAPTNPPKTSK